MARRKTTASIPERTSLVDLLANDISAKIATGSMRIGDKLPSVVELSSHYSVSASVVREAIKTLSVLGLLDVRHGRPTRVSSPSKLPFAGVLNAAVISSEEGFRDAIELRLAIEPMIAYFAASRATPQQLAVCRKTYRTMEKTAGTIKPWVNADLDFHASLADACGNMLLTNLFHAVKATVFETMYLRRVGNKNMDTEGALARHRAILERVEDGDGDGARQLMELHARVDPSVLEAITKSRANRAARAPDWNIGEVQPLDAGN